MKLTEARSEFPSNQRAQADRTDGSILSLRKHLTRGRVDLHQPSIPGPSRREQTFGSLQTRNFRLWSIGQSISMIGFMSQTIALAVLVLDLGGSGVILGLVTALNFAPMLVVGPWAGVLSDRFEKRQIMMVTQTTLMILALVLAAFVFLDRISLPVVAIIAALTGTALAFDQPSRRTIVTELVTEPLAANAVSLNGAINNLAKLIGPAIGGFLVAVAGTAWCFTFNATTYVVVLAALMAMDAGDIHRPETVVAQKGDVREGFRYVRRSPHVRAPLTLLLVVASLSFSWNVLFPLLAIDEFGGGAGTYAIFFASMSGGALAGTLWLAARDAPDIRFLARAGMAFGVMLTLLTLTPNRPLAAIACAGVGTTSMVFLNGTLVTVQLGTEKHLRGRVMAMFSMVLFGSMAVCNPLAGWVADQYGVRIAFALSATSALVAASARLARSHPTPERATR